MRNLSLKRIAILSGAFVFLNLACIPASAQFAEDFIEGYRRAKRDNWEDRFNAERLRQMQLQTQAMQRQQAIDQNISRYNSTGDYRYLFEAASLGSQSAAQHLRQNGIRCHRDNAGRAVCKR